MDKAKLIYYTKINHWLKYLFSLIVVSDAQLLTVLTDHFDCLKVNFMGESSKFPKS